MTPVERTASLYGRFGRTLGLVVKENQNLNLHFQKFRSGLEVSRCVGCPHIECQNVVQIFGASICARRPHNGSKEITTECPHIGSQAVVPTFEGLSLCRVFCTENRTVVSSLCMIMSAYSQSGCSVQVVGAGCPFLESQTVLSSLCA